MISLTGAIAGLCFSYYTGSASGASIVLVNSAFFLICFIISFLKKNS
ncbi:metal ABC transporter permease [Treponema succinifaciens]